MCSERKLASHKGHDMNVELIKFCEKRRHHEVAASNIVRCDAIAMSAAIFVGLTVIGSPTEFRMRRYDERRVNDLTSISSAIKTYRLTHESLPQSLDDLQRSQQSMGYSLRDPVGRPYEYIVRDAFWYELCAEFDTATDNTTVAGFSSYFEIHGLGRHCFPRAARPPAGR